MAGVMLQSWRLTLLDSDIARIPAVAVRLAKLSGARVWAFKVSDGAGLYSEFAQHTRLYTDTAAALRDAGIEVAAWGFHYGRKWLGLVGPEREAKAVLRAREILAFSKYFVDAESRWEQSAREGDAAKLVKPLKDAGLEVWLESFRYPAYHPGILWEEWGEVLNGGWAPQVYWLQASNAAAQVEQSYREHKAVADLPFWPVFPAFCQSGWCPAPAQYRAAIAKAEKLGAAGIGAWKAEWLTENWPAHKSFVDALAEWTGSDAPPEPQPCDPADAIALADNLKRQADTLLAEAQTLVSDAVTLLNKLQAMKG